MKVFWLCVGVACAGMGAAQPPMSRMAPGGDGAGPRSAEYARVQARLARGWNTWDVNSMTSYVLLPEGLAIHVGFKNNTTLFGEEFLERTSVGQGTAIPGPHAWDGMYTELTVQWKEHKWKVQTASVDRDLSILVTPLPSSAVASVPPTLVVWVDYLWNRPGTVERRGDRVEARAGSAATPIYCTCAPSAMGSAEKGMNVPVGGPYFTADLTGPVGISTGKRRSIEEMAMRMTQREAHGDELAGKKELLPIYDAIETTLGWDTIYDPEEGRVISPVSRDWSAASGGYVLFGWDMFFGSTLAAIGDKDLAYANVLEMLREETSEGFVPNITRAGGWKSVDRSEPPVGGMTVMELYDKFHERWFLEDAFEPLLRWNRWWVGHREMKGYLTWGSDGENEPRNPDEKFRGTRAGATGEAGMDGSPIYDDAVFNPRTHRLEFADVGLMSIYVSDCDALAKMADVLGKAAEAKELKERGDKYRAKLKTMWDEKAGIFLNVDLHTGEKVTRLSPANFYPMLAKAATPEQAREMVEKHLLNPQEFWGEWVIPALARNDAAFKDQNYWRGRVWGPMNYLVYMGLRNYDEKAARKDLAEKSYALFMKEWSVSRHVHENYNAITGAGDDVPNSDRFYHWGALLGYMEFVERQDNGATK